MELIDPAARVNIQRWLESSIDEETKQTIERMVVQEPQKVVDAFYTTLQFGTGGLRGITGIGSNRINSYTIRQATQGLANYLKKSAGGPKISVCIGYDSRVSSLGFAADAAEVLAGNGIEVYLFDELRPTPLVSFACRKLSCDAAIMITASHNPPEYNGFKVYWSDGAQVLSPHDTGIMNEISAIDRFSDIVFERQSSLIYTIDKEIDEAYYDAMEELTINPDVSKKRGDELSIHYSNLHGTGITLFPQTLARWGFTNISFVKKQKKPDGTFPTVTSPNPEDKEALSLGIQEQLEQQKDLLLATDPDADRVGAVVLHKGEAVILSGNQIACLCLEHLCSSMELPKRCAFIKTIATTELFRKIAEENKRPCFDVLTGFKYIAKLIGSWEKNGSFSFLFGAEESYGYLLGTKARDKDAMIASCLIADAALACKLEGKTLIDLMEEIYKKYGFFSEKLISLKFPETKEGREKMKATMKLLAEDPPKEFSGIAVAIINDYNRSVAYNLATMEKTDICQPQSDAYLFWLDDGSKILVRSSGTEPKIKIYIGTSGKREERKSVISLAEELAAFCKNLFS